MSQFTYTTTNSDSVLCTGYRKHNGWRTGRTTAAAYQGYYAYSPDGGYDDNRIGVVYIPGLSGLKGTKINSIIMSVTVGSSGVHSWATKNLIFRKSYINNADINTSLANACLYAFGSSSYNSITDSDYDSDILGTLSGKLAQSTTDITLSSSSNSTFFANMKSYIEAGNDTFVFYNPDTTNMWTKDGNGDGVVDSTLDSSSSISSATYDSRYSYEFLNVTGLTITVNYSKSYTVTLDATSDGSFKSGSSSVQTKTLTKWEDEDLTLSESPTKGSVSGTFRINGTTFISNPSSVSQTATKKTNYKFSKWNTKSDGTGTSYSAGGIYSSNADATLYASYEVNNYEYSNNVISASKWWDIVRSDDLNATYTITFDGNGGECTITSLSADKITTYTLDGWFSGENGTGTRYTNTSSFTSQIQLYANWASTTTTTSITLPALDTVTRKGYDFINWNTSTYGTGTAYAAGSSYTPTASITLYAFYEAKGLIRIYTGSTYREALVWVFNGSKWVQAIPYIFNGTEWKIGG